MKRVRRFTPIIIPLVALLAGVLFIYAGVKKPTIRFQKSLPLGLEAEWDITKSGITSLLLPGPPEGSGHFKVSGGSLYFSKSIPLLKEVSGEMYLAKDTVVGERFRGELLGVPLEFGFRHSPSGLSFVCESDSATDLFSLTGEIEGPLVNFSLKLPGRKEISGKAEIIREGDGSLRIEGLVGDYSLSAALLSPSGEKDFALKIGGFPLSAGLQEDVSSPRTDEITLSAQLSEDIGFEVLAKLNHFTLLDYDVLTDIHLTGNFLAAPDGGKLLQGRLSTSNSVLDYQPFREFNLDYEISEGECRVRSLEFGEHYTLCGRVAFASLPAVDFLLSIEDAEIADLFVLGPPEATSMLAKGKINGSLRVKGELPEPAIVFHLEGRDGIIGKVAYDMARVDFEGRWPTVEVKDSLLRQNDLSYYFVGEFDLTKLGKKDALASLRLVPREEAMVWNGWSITRSPEEELSATKEVGEDFRVGFKAGGNGGAGGKEAEEMALEYELGDNQSLKMEMRDEEGTLVIEHKMKF